MSLAFLYPGLNGLLRKSDRQRFLRLPEVQLRLAEAEQILDQEFGLKIAFGDFLQGDKDQIYAVANVKIAAVAICALQTGISEALESRLARPPDWVLGCSLGDLARSVYAGAYDFKDAVINHIRFTEHVDGIESIGKNIGVSSSRQARFSEEDFALLENWQVDVSRLTPRFLNIGGRFEDLERVEALAQERGWNTMDILQYPAHSRYIRPYVDAVADRFATVPVQRPRISMFSSLSNQELKTPETIREEFLLSIAQTIHWGRAVETLWREQTVCQFINVGPCRSLMLMMKDLDPGIECVDALEVLA